MKPQLLADVHVEALLLGNMDAAHALELSRDVQRHLQSSLPSQQRINHDVVHLPDACSYLVRYQLQAASG